MKDIQVYLHREIEESRHEEINKITAETYGMAVKKILDNTTLTLQEKKQLLVEMMELINGK